MPHNKNTLPGVGPHAELVLGVIVQVGEHCLLLGRLPELLLAGTGSFPKLDLILCHLNGKFCKRIPVRFQRKPG